MGEVFKAEDTRLKRFVALKFLPNSMTIDEEAKSRFIHEAQTASALDHPNICTIYEIGQDEKGLSYISMAYYEGQTLKDKIKEERIKINQAVNITIQIARGLQKAHEKGIIHRDIKPANIIVTNDGTAKILDFGLAKLANQTMMTKTGITMGTISYMSPEQTRGEPVDQRSDIWSLGVMLYEMLTGELPFRGDYDQAVVYSILNTDPDPPSDLNPDISPGLEAIILKTLSRESEYRYTDMADLIDDLCRAIGEVIPLPILIKRWWLLLIPVLLLLALFSSRIVDPLKKLFNGPEMQSLAVLPLKNLTGDPGQDYFGDGMTDALISELAQIGNFRVISWQSTMKYKNTDKNMALIAAELNVNRIISGSFLRSADRVQVNVNLIEPFEDRHLWTQRFDFQIADVLQFYKDFTKALVSEIQVQLTPEQNERLAEASKVDPKVYDIYLHGVSFADQYTVSGFQNAERMFLQTIDMDSTFALAHAALSRVYIFIGTGYGNMEPMKALGKSHYHAEKAIKFNNELPDAYISLGNYELFAWNWAEAEKYLAKAIESNPNSASAHQYYSRYFQVTAQFEKAILEINMAHQLDPLSLGIRLETGWPYFWAGEYDKAIEIFTQTIEINPNFAMAYYNIASMFIQKKQYDQGIKYSRKAFELDTANVNMKALVAWALAEAGNTNESKQILDVLLLRYEKRQYVSGVWLAIIYNSLGQTDKVFEWLEKAYDQHDFFMSVIKIEPGLKNLRDDRHFQDLVRRIGLSDM